MAPVDRRGERLVTGGSPTRIAYEQREPIIQPGLDLVRCQRPYPRGSELDTQGDAVEPDAQSLDGLGVGRVDGEPGTRLAGALCEQLDRLGGGERRQAPHALSSDAQRFPARRQDRDLRARADHRLGELGDGFEQVLAVVEADQRSPVTQLGGERAQRATRRIDEHPRRDAHGLGHRRRVGRPLKVDPPHPVLPALDLRRGRLRGEPRLSAAACAGDRHKAGVRL